MDLFATNGWRMKQVLPSRQVIERLDAEFPLEQVEPTRTGETAERWRYRDGGGEIGVISSVTQAFCHDCNRARLSTEGKLFLCLFASEGHDLRALLRATDNGSGLQRYSDGEIAAAIRLIWQQRVDRYSEMRGAVPTDATVAARRIEMHYIGG